MPKDLNELAAFVAQQATCEPEEPPQGIFGDKVEYHGAQTPSSVLHAHIGCTLTKGLPITLTIRDHTAPQCLRGLNAKHVYLCLYYQGTNQRVYSQRIPPETVQQLINEYNRPEQQPQQPITPS